MKNQKVLKINRNLEVKPIFIGKTLKIHNGKENRSIKISKAMVGRKFGEFVQTRAKFFYKKKKSK